MAIQLQEKEGYTEYDIVEMASTPSCIEQSDLALALQLQAEEEATYAQHAYQWQQAPGHIQEKVVPDGLQWLQT